MHQHLLKLLIGFDWDEGNRHKSFHKHDVAPEEAEQIFINSPLLVAGDKKHSGHETRHHALGRTNEDRRLFVSFTVREHMIRIISARPMSRTERKVYEKEIKTDS